MSDVGQLFFCGVSGLALTNEEKEFIEEQNIGGIILFAKNYESPGQLAELVNSIQALRKEYPLFIGVDCEGGRVQRFKKPFTQFPPMLTISKTGSPKACFHIHTIMAAELSTCGINVNFAPVCDVLSNENSKAIGDRAFGHDPETVSKFISSAIRGLQTNNILACAKHFPGHGGTAKDSHNELPIINATMAELESRDFPPFVKAVKSRVEFVMMAHLIVDAFDKELPSSLCDKPYLYLRKEMKYANIIITDDMQMGAITNTFGVADAAVRALRAGADMLCYRDLNVAKEAFEAVNEAIKTKKLKIGVIQDKVDRVATCKKEYLKEYSPIYIPGIANKINTRQSQIFMEEINKKIAE